tara:strand:- start:1416 stop:2261 length:846 start_codon:yes stop_codon:yes gene_type:complete
MDEPEPLFNYNIGIFDGAVNVERIAVFEEANRYFTGNNPGYTNFQANIPNGDENVNYRQTANIRYSPDYIPNLQDGWYNVMFGNNRVVRANRLVNNNSFANQNIDAIENFVTLDDLNNAFVVNEQFVVRVYSQKYNMNQRNNIGAWLGYLDSNENSLPYFVLFNNIDYDISQCTCPDYIMREDQRPCKHIIAVRQVQQRLQREQVEQRRQLRIQRLQRLLGTQTVEGQRQQRNRGRRRSARLAASSGRRLRSGRIVNLVDKPFIGSLDHLFSNMDINKENN